MADTQTPNSREMAAGMELKEQLIRELEQFYDDGNAFFTKQAMRDIAVQLGAESSESDKGTMAKDLKGEPHFFRKPKNRSMDLKDEPDRKLVKYEARPVLSYSPIDHMLARIRWTDAAGFQKDDLDLIPISVAWLQSGGVSNEPGATVSPFPLLPFAKAQQRFREKRIEWEASEAGCKFKSLLDSADILSVRKVIAFACSPLAWDVEGCHRSLVQHAATLAIRDHLLAKQSDTPDAIQCYAQDPQYTDTDKQVLQEEGITVVDDPRGFLELDDETVVLAIAPDISVRQITADLARPAMMVWDDVTDRGMEFPMETDFTVWADASSSRVKKMVEDYVALEVHDLEHFGKNVTIYVRKSSATSESEGKQRD